MQKDIKEGMSPNYKEPYSYRQNTTETFDDMDQPTSALETRKGFDLLKTYDRAREGWPSMKTALVHEKTMADKLRDMYIRKGLDPDTGEYIPGQYTEDISGNAANLSTGASIGNQTPENALAIRTMHSKGLGKAQRGVMSNEWDSAYASLSETSKELQKLLHTIQLL